MRSALRTRQVLPETLKKQPTDTDALRAIAALVSVAPARGHPGQKPKQS